MRLDWNFRRMVSGMVSLVTLALVSAAFADDVPAKPGAPMQAPVFQNRLPADQLAFLNSYGGQTTKEILKDKRFKALLKELTPRTEYHYGRDMSLDETIHTMLDGKPMPVDVRENRYVMVTSGGGPYLHGRGFVWVDTQEGIAIGGVYFHPTNGEPTPTLAIFSRQIKQQDLGLSQLPAAFQMDLQQWSAEAGVPPIPVLYFVPDNGKKYALMHDEDYCAHAPGTPAPPLNACQEMNLDAADADMNAAYFMKLTHNAANATAWMLEPEQVAWIGFRQRTCGVAVDCRIRVTRIRIRELTRR